ncbi:MAG: hypothetical protein KDK36_09330 [Leptospiraceae bacterium]|nr:hypothetical protein [Leptospiraceae bacterium]
MLENIFVNKPHCILLHNLDSKERDLLEFSLMSLDANIVKWDPAYGSTVFHPGEVVLAPFSDGSIGTWKDWSLPTSIIGRLSEDDRTFTLKNSISSFWDLEKEDLNFYLPYIGKFYNSHPRKVLIWTENHLFNEILKSMFPFLNFSCIATGNPEYALNVLNENKFDLIFLDWDYSGMEPMVLIKELKKIKETRGERLPEIIGIKDFNKMNIFKDLSSGLRDFCAVLFSYQEAIELLIRSFPIEQPPKIQSYMDTELPILMPGSLNDSNGRVFLEYKKENKISTLKNSSSVKEFKSLCFKMQFEWLVEFGFALPT